MKSMFAFTRPQRLNRRICNSLNILIQKSLRLRRKHKEEKISLARIKNRNPKFFSPEEILDSSDESARRLLAKTLGTSHTSSSKLLKHLISSGQGFFDKAFGNKLDYDGLVREACAKLSISKPSSAYQGERSISISCFKEAYEKLSPSQKKEYEEALRKYSKSLECLDASFTPAMISAGAIIAGKMSGFGVYLAASTIVGAMTNVAGITLPFVFYTTMSSAISVFLGPVGWAVTGAFVIGKLLAPDFSKVIQGIIIIASLRSEKELQWQSSIAAARKELRLVSRSLREITLKIFVLRAVLASLWMSVPILIFLLVILLK